MLANDSSNFLTATKLAGAIVVPGEDDTLANNLIAQVAALSGVSDGDFSINGVAMSIDTANDNLEDVIMRINASVAGVTATLDRDTSLISIRSRSTKDVLDPDDGTSGFFAAIGISPTVHRPIVREAARRSGFGLDFDFSSAKGILVFDRESFEKASVEKFEALHDFPFLEGTGHEPQGLVTSLLRETNQLVGFVERKCIP